MAGTSRSKEPAAKRPKTKPANVVEAREDELTDQPNLPSAQTLAEKLMAREDSRRTVNFSKYELPKRDAAPPPPPRVSSENGEDVDDIDSGEEARMAFDFLAAATQPQEAPSKAFDLNGAAPRRKGRPPRRSASSKSAAPPERDFAFEQPPALEEPPAPEQPVLRAGRQKNAVREFAFDEFNAAPEPPRDQPKRPRRQTTGPEAQPAPAPSPAPAPWAAAAPESVPTDGREEFMRRISQQFEQQFSEKFSEGAPLAGRPPLPPPPDNPPARAVSPPRFENPAAPMPREPELEDNVAEDFISQFRQGVREEETKAAEDFKETLAEKFMRERERYLKELGIAEQIEQENEPQPVEPQIGPAQSPRRRLDFQIVPELHMDRDVEPPSRMHANPAVPLTYTRAGTAQPQRFPDDETPPRPAAPNIPFAPPTANGGKKTSEQLLLELGAQTRIRGVQAAFQQPQPNKPPKPFQFRFETAEEQEQNRKLAEKAEQKPRLKWPRRTIVLSASVGFVAIALIAWVLLTYLDLVERLSPASPASSASSASQSASGDMEVHDSYTFAQRGSVDNIFIKKADVTVRNADVSGYVLIEGVDTAGTVRLEDINVEGAVSFSDTVADTLELHNVKAGRVIVNTDKATVNVRASGSTDVAVLELRTNSKVFGDASLDTSGFRSVIVRPREQGQNMDAEFTGLSLQTLEMASNGAETTLRFSNTRAETLTAEGSLSLLGDGRVASLVLGGEIGQGAGESSGEGLLSLLVKGVSVGSINVRGTAALNIGSAVDQIFATSSLSLGGDGSVGALTLNPQFGNGRLLIDIAGLTVQDIYANAEARINSTGSSRVNTITANESTYALGNKVNLLKVNANDVIYENEPDKIQTSSGIRPPQTKADNPNLNYDIGPDGSPTDLSEDDLATTCGHPRQSGGFIVGDGSVDTPFEVSNALQLTHVTLHPSSHFVQTADIDISAESAYASGFPVICPDDPFTGVFDGRGYSIENLRIQSMEEDVGLFSKNKGIIRNVHITSGDISSSGSGNSYVGAIAGYNYEGGVIQNCSNGARVSGGTSASVGGIVGYNFNSAKIRDCYNFARIVGDGFAGGLAGTNGQAASITGSYNAGAVSGRNSVGAVLGANDGGVVTNCYYLEQTADEGIGTGGGTAYERTDEELRDAQMVVDLTAGNESSLWTAGATASGGYRYPVLNKPE